MRMSTRFLIQKSVQKIFFRYMYCATRPTYQIAVPGYIRRGQSRRRPLRTTLKNGCNHPSGYLRPGEASQRAAALGGRPQVKTGNVRHLRGVTLKLARTSGPGLICSGSSVESLPRALYFICTGAVGVSRVNIAGLTACPGSLSARHDPTVAAGYVNSGQHVIRGMSFPNPLRGWRKPMPKRPVRGSRLGLARGSKSRCLMAAGDLGVCGWLAPATVLPDSRG